MWGYIFFANNRDDCKELIYCHELLKRVLDIPNVSLDIYSIETDDGWIDSSWVF